MQPEIDPVQTPQTGNAEPKVPRHVAIIMDGNGRWARKRGLPHSAGHKRGAETARKVITAAAKAGVSYLTIFGFSSENWNRPTGEVTDLMGLLRYYLEREVKSLEKEGVRFRVIGNRALLPGDIRKLIDSAEERTKNNTVITLLVALSYGGRDEIVRAAQKLAARVSAGEMQADAIDEAAVAAELETTGIPDPDLLIRTSGEQRLSNFLLWQAAYCELVFTDTLWPDFGADAFNAALDEYGARERRFGAAHGGTNGK